MASKRIFKQFSVGLIFVWFALFALLPFVLVLLASFLKPGLEHFFTLHFTVNNYTQLFQPIYLKIFLRSFQLALITTFFCLILAYPFAYICARLPEWLKPILMFLVILPFWSSSLIRIYSMIIVIRNAGFLNRLLLWLDVIHHPLNLLFTQTAVLIGLVYTLLPFMILPLYANLEKFDWRLLDAARDLGAGRLRTLFQIVIPNTMPGIIGGTLLVLLPAMTLFYIPDILGGAKSLLLGNLIKNQFFEAHNWPLGAAISSLLTIIMGIMILVYWKLTTESDRQDLL